LSIGLSFAVYNDESILPILITEELERLLANFLDGVSSVYRGFRGTKSFADALVGTAYAIVDDSIGGFALAWMYNFIVRMNAPNRPEKSRRLACSGAGFSEPKRPEEDLRCIDCLAD